MALKHCIPVNNRICPCILSCADDIQGHEQAQNSQNRGGVVRRDPVANVHPLVRTHPVSRFTANHCIYG
jgi:hypothetical protein